MCGINGLMSHDESAKRKVSHLNKLLKHRGPDDEGFVFIDPRSGKYKQFSGDDSIEYIKKAYPNVSSAEYSSYDLILAQRRLAIIDLSECGHGPMSDPSGKVWITYNGEIYNYIELREELKSAGYKFLTATDTEVILNSYLHWGYDCLNHFNGMWAFCIYDTSEQKLFLARDRFGIKPLYYTVFTENSFAFSSELKPLIYLNPGDFSVNSDKLAFFILHGNRLNSDDTYIKNIHCLPASHFAVYKDGALSVKKYYEIRVNSGLKNNSEKELEYKLIELLSDSVKLRFRSDVPVGTCLSGGFDSSSIVSLATRLNINKLETFSAVWKDKECDETRYIDIVNREFNCIENKTEPDAGEFESVFSKICYYQEIPTEGPGLYPQWYVMRKAKEKVKVLLDGQGGDEVFGGYFSKGTYLRSILKEKNVKAFMSEFGEYKMFLNKNDFHALAGWMFPRLYSSLVYRQVSERYKVFNSSILKTLKKNTLNSDIQPPRKFKSYLNDLAYHFITNMTIPTLLHYEDRSSMAHSIESRVPFLDYRLVEFGVNLPSKYLVHDDTSRPLFRKSISPYLPAEIVNRKDKLGYPVPFAKWTRRPLKNYITDSLANTNSPLFDYLDKKNVKQNLELHFSGKIDYSWDIWRLLSLGKFLNIYHDLTIV